MSSLSIYWNQPSFDVVEKTLGYVARSDFPSAARISKFWNRTVKTIYENFLAACRDNSHIKLYYNPQAPANLSDLVLLGDEIVRQGPREAFALKPSLDCASFSAIFRVRQDLDLIVFFEILKKKMLPNQIARYRPFLNSLDELGSSQEKAGRIRVWLNANQNEFHEIVGLFQIFLGNSQKPFKFGRELEIHAQLFSIPPEIKHLTSLSALTLINSRIQLISPEIQEIADLKERNFSLEDENDDPERNLENLNSEFRIDISNNDDNLDDDVSTHSSVDSEEEEGQFLSVAESDSGRMLESPEVPPSPSPVPVEPEVDAEGNVTIWLV